jgi:arylsulfatase A-like enzyme
MLVAGWLVGAGGTLGRPSLPAALFAAALASVPAAALGLVGWGLLALLWWSGWLERARKRLAPFASRDPGADRQPVVRLHAYLVAVVLALVVVGQLHVHVIGRLWALQEAQLAMQLVLYLAVGSAAGCLFAVPLVARACARPLGWLDARAPLPLPPWGPVRYLGFVVVPALAFLVSFEREHGAVLGRADVGPGLAMLVVLAPLVGYLWRAVRPGRRWARRTALAAVAAIAVVLLAGTDRLYDRLPDAARTAEQVPLADLGALTLRTLGDVDRDGAAPWFGGGDCAPFDATRGPAAFDVPGNGIDEDCDGRDGDARSSVAGELVPRPQFFGRLAPERVRKYNIVWIIVDALRADHVSALGYPKPTTPSIDALARESILFTQAYSQSSATVLSFPSMIIGANPGSITWSMRGRLQPADDELTLAERLSAIGYRTGLVLDKYTAETFTGMQKGFDTVTRTDLENVPKRKWENRCSALAFMRAVEFVSEAAPGPRADPPFLLAAYFPDPHAPYTRHADVPGKFGDEPSSGYDTELAFADRNVGLLLDFLRARPLLWQDTIVIVVGDHGEEFGEHGGKRHAFTCHEESVHVPVVMHIPGFAPRRIDAPVGLVDITPTLLELVGAPLEGRQLDGQSLLVPIEGERGPEAPRSLFCSIVSQKRQQGTFFRQAVRRGGYSLHQEVNDNRFRCYDQRTDPGETRDLSADPRHRGQCDGLKALLKASLRGNLQDHRHFREKQ